MNRTVMLLFYPRPWRVRYEDEFSALLEQLPLTPSMIFDTLRGALDAHLRPTCPATRHGRNAMQQPFLMLAVAFALQHPRPASGAALPRRRHGLFLF